MKILVTGGCGYIGSHTVCELLNNNYDVVILDNLSNSSLEVVDKIKSITNKNVKFYKGDMLDKLLLDNIFKNECIDAVIDFAAYKAVGESVKKPVEYYTNNVSTVLVLLDVMKRNNVKKMVFSSSATVYGNPKRVPIVETDEIGDTTNPYGTSKVIVEKILSDLYESDSSWAISILRYFNPIGAHSSGLIGENPKGIPANLMPYVLKVANKELPILNIFGNDYDTADGTCVRDYIHVVDLAKGHIKALEKLDKENNGLFIYNLGTGHGYSVLDVVNTFIKVNHVDIPYEIAPRRVGDITASFADCSKAKEELGWEAKLNIEDMCKDSYNYVLKSK